LFVPAPIIPKAKMALFFISLSSSWESFTKTSITYIFGLEIDKMAKANGIALFKYKGAYCNKLFICLKHISKPIGSLVEIKAMAIIANC